MQTEKNKNPCPRTEIAAYIDGELSPREEMDLELHFAVCGECAAEFNEQKKLLCALDFALDEKAEFELPEDFTKSVVVKAESNVSGLRRREERFRALYLCAILFLLIIARTRKRNRSGFFDIQSICRTNFCGRQFCGASDFRFCRCADGDSANHRRSIYLQSDFCDFSFRYIFDFFRLYFLAHSGFI